MMLTNFSLMVTMLTSNAQLGEQFHCLSALCSNTGRPLPYIYTVPRIFSPRNRLKAICLKKTSMAFLAILVKRAREALLYR